MSNLVLGYNASLMAFYEDARVKIPALIHLTRLGYNYFSLKEGSFKLDRLISRQKHWQ